MSSLRRDAGSWPDVGLLILYFALRLHRVGNFPVFIDEAFHIRWARDVWSLSPFGSADEGKALIAWLLAPFWPFHDALWLSRTAVILVTVLGLAGLIGLGRNLMNRQIGRAAALVAVFLPYPFFFDRLALADSVAASAGLCTAFVVVRAIRDRRHSTAALGGVLLLLALLTKLSMIVVLAVPVLAVMLLSPITEWRKSLPLMITIYGVCSMLAAPLLAVAWGHTDFGLHHTRTNFFSTDLVGLPGRILGNVQTFVAWMNIYIGWPLLVLSGAGSLIALIRRDGRAVFVVSLALLPTIEFWMISTYILPRFYLLGVGAGLLLAAYAAVYIYSALSKWNLLPQRILGAGAIICFAAIIAPMARFILIAYSSPEHLPLVGLDHQDYIAGSTSGFGLIEAARRLQTIGSTGTTTVICSDRITCDRLSVYVDNNRVNFERTDILTPRWVDDQDQAGNLVLLAEDNPPIVSSFEPGTEYRLVLLQTYTRPGGKSSLDLYQIRAQH